MTAKKKSPARAGKKVPPPQGAKPETQGARPGRQRAAAVRKKGAAAEGQPPVEERDAASAASPRRERMDVQGARKEASPKAPSGRTKGMREAQKEAPPKAPSRGATARQAKETARKPRPSGREGKAAGGLEQLEAEYDQAIRGYASYHLQQEGIYGGAYGWGGEGAQGVQSDEDRLQQVEQAAVDFHAALPYIRSMRGAEKSQYLAKWREYLTGIAALAAEVVDALEKDLSELSEPTE